MTLPGKARRMLDANVLIRYLVGTPPDHYEAARGLIEGADPVWLPVVAILETAYVLTRTYRVPRSEVIDTLTDFLRRANVQVCEVPRQRAIDALALCRPSGQVGFGDAFIWARAAEDGAEVVTFDRHFPTQGVSRTVLP